MINNEKDFEMLRIWARRFFQDVINWFRITNPRAYQYRHSKSILLVIMKGQVVGAAIGQQIEGFIRRV